MSDRLSPVNRVTRRAEAGHATQLQTCRVIYGAAAVLIVGFGAVYHLALPQAVDPWSTRLSLAAICGTLLVATSFNTWLQENCAQVVAGLVGGLTAWFVILTALNGFATAYGLGLVFTIASVGLALLMTQDGVRPVIFYAAASTITVGAFILVTRPPAPNAWLTIGAVAGIGIIIVLSSRLRTHLVRSLAASEKRFRKLSEAAFEAIFITDDDVIVDCNTNALLLLGHTSRARLLGCSLSDFFPRSERDAQFGDESPPTPYRVESRMLRSDGTLVPVELRGRSAADGQDDLRVVAVRDISEQKAYERELIASRRRIEETLEIRSAILTNVSHEFRTPLAIMLGYAEMLKEEKYDDAGELGELIYESGRQLNDTLNLILELAQIEGGRTAVAREEVDLAELIENVVRTHRQRASVKLLGLKFTAGESNHVALVDRIRVLKVVDYLIDNAIKFTDDGHIDVEVTSDDAYAYVSVSDTGVGIDEAFLPHLFEPFKQESSGLTRSHGGLGVGLTIAHQMVESMGGELTVESRKGSGSTFTVRLPKSTEDSMATAIAPAGGASTDQEGSAAAVWL